MLGCNLYLMQIQQRLAHGHKAAAMDTKFSVAIHVLVLASESPTPMSSAQMAASVGTNASYVRKIIALLKQAKIIESHQGATGYALLARPQELSLLRVYQAVMGDASPHILDIHRNPNDACAVGRNIKPVLGSLFGEAEDSFRHALEDRTLADCIGGIRQRLRQEEQKEL